MANPEMPSANHPQAPAPAPDARPSSTAIQEQDAVIPIPSSTAITGAAAPAAAGAAPAPEKEAPALPDPQRLADRIRRLERVLVGLVLALAFLLGCFTINNSDFWMHLATGRLLARGELAL